MAFGETLTFLRKTKGLSQEQLAEELDLARQTISKWELNQSKPDFDYLIQLSDFFGVTTDYLIKGEQASEPPSGERGNSGAVGAKRIGIKLNKATIYKTIYKCCFYLGIAGMCVSLIGITAFVIHSVMRPYMAIVDSRTYEGLLGYLIGGNKLWDFMALVLLFIVGCILAVYGIVKKKRLKQ